MSLPWLFGQKSLNTKSSFDIINLGKCYFLKLINEQKQFVEDDKESRNAFLTVLIVRGYLLR